MLGLSVLLFAVALLFRPCRGWAGGRTSLQRIVVRLEQRSLTSHTSCLLALSDEYLENDLVAIKASDTKDTQAPSNPRFCVVRADGGVYPLCTHEDDVETDLFIDPRVSTQSWTDDVVDGDVVGGYGEGWYGQRPVPSLGGGPGYGAEADPVWSVDEELLETLKEDGVDLPVLDVGIAHGEKARGGAF